MGVWVVALVYVLLLAIVWIFVSKRTRSLHDEIEHDYMKKTILFSVKRRAQRFD